MLAAIAHTLHGGLRCSYRGLVCPRARRRRTRQGVAALDPRNRDQTAIEFIRLALVAEATPVSRRELVVLLFDTKIVDENGRSIEMSKGWIVVTNRSGAKRYIQVKHISSFGTHQEGYTFIGIAGDQDPIQVRETPEAICVLLGMLNDG